MSPSHIAQPPPSHCSPGPVCSLSCNLSPCFPCAPYFCPHPSSFCALDVPSSSPLGPRLLHHHRPSSHEALVSQGRSLPAPLWGPFPAPVTFLGHDRWVLAPWPCPPGTVLTAFPWAGTDDGGHRDRKQVDSGKVSWGRAAGSRAGLRSSLARAVSVNTEALEV